MSTKHQTQAPVHQPLDSEIETLVQQIRQHQATIAEEEGAVYLLKTQLLKLLEIRGTNWSDEYGYARLAQEGKRIHYDMSALDNLIISDPLRYGWLHEYRKEIVLPSRVQVR